MTTMYNKSEKINRQTLTERTVDTTPAPNSGDRCTTPKKT